MKASYLPPLFLAATLFVSPIRAEDEVKNTLAPVAVPTPVPAPAPAPAMTPKDHHLTDAEIIKRYDTNHDGKLDESEIAAVKEQQLQADNEQREEKFKKLQERQQSLLKEFDKNGDGKLDAEERATMERTLRARVEANPRWLKRFDTDGDGKLSDAEWAAAREKVIGRLMEERKK